MTMTEERAELGLWSLMATLRGQRWVDLTQTFSPRMPHHPSFRPAEFRHLIVVTWPKAEKGSGFPARAFAICPK